MLWFSSNYFYNIGLSQTSVSSSCVLSNTSSIFVYMVSLMLLNDTKFSWFRLLMIICSFMGVVVITDTDHKVHIGQGKNDTL